MIHILSTALLVLAFAGAGVHNLRSDPKLKADYVRWGYPVWWNGVTGAAELVAAALTAAPVTQAAGLLLGAIVVTAATATILRHRELSHLAPLGLFAVLIACTALTR